jgi:hypothetical protein
MIFMAVFKGFAGNRIADGFLLVAQWQFYREFAIVCGIDGVVFSTELAWILLPMG